MTNDQQTGYRCDYSVGIGNARCPAGATHWRYAKLPDGRIRKTKSCEHHRYPSGQSADTERLWVTSIDHLPVRADFTPIHDDSSESSRSGRNER